MSKLQTFVSLWLVGLASVSFGQAQTNLISNGDFESGLSGWKINPHAKVIEIDGESVLYFKAPLVKDIDATIHESHLSYCVPIDSGSEFNLSSRFRYDSLPDNPIAHRSYIFWYQSRDCSTGGQFGAYLEPKPTLVWQSLDRGKLIPSLNARSGKIVLTQHQEKSAKKLVWWKRSWLWVKAFLGSKALEDSVGAYWDDIRLVPFNEKISKGDQGQIRIQKNSPGFNLIRNSRFIENGDHWRFFGDWAWSSESGFEKSGSVRTTINSKKSSKGTGVGRYCAKLDGNQEFELGVKVKRSTLHSSQKGSGRLRLIWSEKANCTGRSQIDPKWLDIPPGNGWKTLKVDGLKPPANARGAVIELIQSIEGAGFFSVFWDDAYFRVKQK